MKYVALLRGVNVGGITIKNADLKTLFADLGFADVRTVLASGNVVFEADGEAARLKRTIEQGLAERFGYDAWIVLVSQLELGKIAAAYPFARSDEVNHPYVVFGSDEGVLDELAAAGDDGADVERVQRGEGVVYWEVPRGSTLESPFGKLIAKAKYKPHITTRNLRTVEKLL